MKKTLLTTMLTALLAAGVCPFALAQDATPPANDVLEPATPAAESAEGAKKAKNPKKDESPWSFRAALRNVFDSNIDQDEDDVDSRGFVAGLGLNYQARTPIGGLKLDYEIGSHSYTNTESWDRTTHDLEAILENDLGGQWRAQTTGEIAIKDASDDGDIRDAYTLEQRLEYRVTPVYRLRVEGALRQKKYDEDPRRDASDPYVGFGLIQRHPNNLDWDTEFRYDRNRADDGRFTYQRWTIGSAVAKEFDDRNTASLEARYRIRRYEERWVSTETGVSRRKDRYWVIESRWDHVLTKGLELRFDYVFETRRSNDDGNDFDDHILATTLTQRW